MCIVTYILLTYTKPLYVSSVIKHAQLVGRLSCFMYKQINYYYYYYIHHNVTLHNFRLALTGPVKDSISPSKESIPVWEA